MNKIINIDIIFEKIQPYLDVADFNESIKIIKKNLKYLNKKEEISEAFDLLATFFIVKAGIFRTNNKQKLSIRYYCKAEDAYKKALEMFSENIHTRISLGRFYLNYIFNPQKSEFYLNFKCKTTYFENKTFIFYEHQRLALLATAIILKNFDRKYFSIMKYAYSSFFSEIIQQPDLTPLEILIRNKIKLSNNKIKSIIDSIKEFKKYDIETVNKIYKSLSKNI